MDTAVVAMLIAGGALMLNFVDKILGGGWKLSGRITNLEANTALLKERMESGDQLSSRVTKIETGIDGIQSEIRKLVEAVGKMADMRTEIRVLDERLNRSEIDIRELRHGRGFIRGGGGGGVDGEYP
jgi:uncharacterized coiled-coil protein SlyX